MLTSLLVLQVSLYLLGGLGGFLFRKQEELVNRFVHITAFLAGVAGMGYSLAVLLGLGRIDIELPQVLPFGAFHLAVDPLSAFFVFAISFLSLAASIFAIGYSREYFGKHNIALLGFFFHTFILAMILVVTVKNAFYFLVVWELMSLASYFLVIFEHEKPAALKAGTLYFIMTHVGTAFITGAFLLLIMASGGFGFDGFREASPSLGAGMKNVIFLAAIVGFGTKAGVIPLHIWLPEAHPQAPSHVSALMSGVMIKTAIYALLRFVFDFLDGGFFWWGMVILVIAVSSTLLGILYALMEHDLKRLLAFSSIENVGIILLGVGMSMLFVSVQQPVFAAFALTASLLHVLNHAAFKGLLFLSAGAVLSRTHTRNMEELGGLIKRLPWTGAFFLIGAVAISALPPLNGFVSEWMTFIALLLGIQAQSPLMRFFAPVFAAALGLAGALAATCFVKAFGITFLGTARSHEANDSREAGFSMILGMGILAASCVGFAVFSPWIVSVLETITAGIVGRGEVIPKFSGRGILLAPEDFSQLSPTFIFLILFILGLVAIVFVRGLVGRARVRIGPSWDSGVPKLEARMQYTATGYSKPIRRIFSFLYQPTRRVEIEDEGHEILRTAQRFESGIRPIFEESLYQPLAKMVLRISEKMKQIQTGYIQLYLSYIFVALILLLIFVRLS